jgi:protein-S-isoprenylcysteine O-methyltransferase Ste14
MMNIILIEKTMWFATLLYWVIASFSVKKTVKKQSGWERILYIFCVLLAFGLLFNDISSIPVLNRQLLPQNDLWKIAGMIFCAVGLIFSIVARIWLGENWSGRITIKENHELIQSGPYSVTRNPIYTGFLLAFVGSSMSLGLLKGYLGIFFLVVCILIKISKEEAFMQEVFGEKYRSYKAKVKRLVPLLY